MTGVLEKVDRDVVDRGLDLVWALPRPQGCERARAENDVAMLPSPEQQTAVEDLQAQLAAATAGRVAGQYDRAIELALDVQTRAGEVGFEPLVLQAQAQHGELLGAHRPSETRAGNLRRGTRRLRCS